MVSILKCQRIISFRGEPTGRFKISTLSLILSLMDFKVLLGWEAIRVAKGEEIVISLDWEGVPFGIYMNGKFYRRALDGKIQEKWRESKDGKLVKRRKFLSDDEKEEVIDKTGEILILARRALYSRSSVTFDGVSEEAIDEVSDIFLNFKERIKRSESAFDEVYGHVGILPPDQYLSLVLQVTLGCHWNKCTFCGFYRKVPFKIKKPGEFKEHLRKVRHFFRRGLRLRRSIFLSEANALIAPWEILKAEIDNLSEEFHISPRSLKGRELKKWLRRGEDYFEGIYSFVDAPTGKKLSLDQLQWLKKRGLRRIYIGLESGAQLVYELLNKPGGIEETIESVNTIKNAGIAVGVIVLMGIGGKKLSGLHVKETVKILNRMNLGKGDIIYLSPYREVGGTEFPSILQRKDLTPMGPEDIEREKRAFAEGLKEVKFKKGIPIISIYDIEEFVY